MLYLSQGVLGDHPGPLLDDGLALCGEDLLGAPVELGVLDKAVAVGEPGVALGTAVRLLALQEQTVQYVHQQPSWARDNTPATK